MRSSANGGPRVFRPAAAWAIAVACAAALACVPPSRADDPPAIAPGVRDMLDQAARAARGNASGSPSMESPAAARPESTLRAMLGRGARPAQALIRGVPFVGWREAAAHDYPRRDLLNPSAEAAREMVLGYWGADVKPEAFAELIAREGRDGASLEDLEASLARGVPTLVYAALTRVAHPVDPAAALAIGKVLARRFDPRNPGPGSGALGPMIPLVALRALPDTVPNPVRESIHLAVRVAIGYDDARGVIVLHDPSFGPALELSRADFETMWAAAGRRLVPLRLGDPAAAAARHANESYRARSADERGAECFVNGVALAADGRGADAEAEYRRGLALLGLSPGYRHLLAFDLALALEGQARVADAIAAAREAAALVPDDAGPWRLLTRLYAATPSPEHRKLWSEAANKLRKLERDRHAIEALAAALPADFFIPSLGPARGWGAKKALP